MSLDKLVLRTLNVLLARSRQTARDERGISLILVIGTAGVLTVLATVILFQAMTNLQQSRIERFFEQSLHVADGGVDTLLYRVSDSKGTYTTEETVPDSFASVGAEKQWALDAADAAVEADPTRLVPSSEGEWVGIAPVNKQLVYAVGYVPSKANPIRSRVLRVEWDLFPVEIGVAILTGDNLTISGNPNITGEGGSAHTNQNLVVSGNPIIEGHSTASGIYIPGGADIGDPDNSGGGKPEISIPPVDPRESYPKSEYDLCPDGTVRPGPAYTAGSETKSDGTPCTGDVLADTTTTGSYRAWRRSSSSPVVWETDGDTAFDGVYYAFEGNIKVGGSPGKGASPDWKTTLIAEARGSGAGEPDCPHTGGDIEISGNPEMIPALSAPSLIAVAGRDLMINGNPRLGTEDNPGELLAHEQFQISGNPIIYGSIIGEGSCNTTGSPVGPGSHISGNPQVSFNPLVIDLGYYVRGKLWLEL